MAKEAFTLFEIEIELTEKGDQNYFKVIEIVYLLINNLSSTGAQPYIYKEMQQKAQIDFQNLQKKDAVSLATQIGRRMNYMADDADYVKLMEVPYILDDLDQGDISDRIRLLDPEQMFVAHWSPSFQKELEANPDDFKKEYFYSKHFTVKMISDDEIKKLREASTKSVYPDRDESEVKLGNPPENKFMPSPENIKSMKVDRPADGKAALPKCIKEEGYNIWFKQDDTFDQPLVKIACFMYTRDGGYPDSLRSILLAKLWKKCLKQHVNDMADMAFQAGIKSNVSVTSKYIRLNYQCYNDKISEYLSYLFDNLHKCEMDQELFKNVVDKKIRTQKNILKGEPYSKIMMYFKRAVLGEYTPEQLIETYNSISYEEFIEFKGKFMQKLCFDWIVCGHILENDAKKLCQEMSKSPQGYLSIDQKPEAKKIFEIGQKMVYQLELSSQAPKEHDPDGGKVINPNSALRCLFQFGEFSYATEAVV